MAIKIKSRSPNYPGISLEAAIHRARIVWNAEKKHAATAAVICADWELSSKGGGAMVVLAALRRFGLLEEGAPSGEDKTYKLSQLALTILLEPDDSEARARAIEEAALRPEIHRKLWGVWGGELPSLPSMKSVLIREHNFTESGAEDFIKQFRSTLAFSGLLGKTTFQLQEPESSDKIEDMPEQSPQAARSIQAVVAAKEHLRTGGIDLPLPLLSGGTAILRLPHKLTKDDFAWVTTMLDKLKGTILETTENK